MVLALKPGLVVLKKFEEKHLFLVLSGFFLYENNNLSVLVTDEATQLSEDTPEAHERGYRKIFGENHKKDFYDDH